MSSTALVYPSNSSVGFNPLSSVKTSSRFQNSTVSYGISLSRSQAQINRNKSSLIHSNMGHDNHDQSRDSQTPKAKKPFWANWMYGWIFTAILPLAHLKGGNLLKIGPLREMMKVAKVVEEVAEVVEETAEVVEKASEVLEKISDEVAESLPDDDMLKKAALAVEHASEEMQKNAKLAIDLMNKVEGVKEQIEKDVEMLMNAPSVTGVEQLEKNRAGQERKT